jgi:hypothetical protein
MFDKGEGVSLGCATADQQRLAASLPGGIVRRPPAPEGVLQGVAQQRGDLP